LALDETTVVVVPAPVTVKVVPFVSPDADAEMVVLPAHRPFATPAELIPATVAALEVQAT
jgi:hypothetical protein